MKTGTHFFF